METQVRTNIVPMTEENEIFIPLGQRLLRAGFKRIEREEIRKILDCDNLAIQLYLDQRAFLEKNYPFVEPNKGNRSRHPTVYAYRSKSKRFWGNWQTFATLQHCTFSLIDLDIHVRLPIPDRVLKEAQRAIDLGIETFYVAEPTFVSPDPVVIALFDKEMIFIAQWNES